MKTKQSLIFVILAAAYLIGCKKQNAIIPSPTTPAADQYQLSVRAITKEVSEVLADVYADHRALMEVNAAIASGYYEDERVLLKDLLFPESSDLYKSGALSKFKTDTGHFRRMFCEIIDKGKFPLLSAELKRAPKTLISNGQSAMLDDNVPSVSSATSPVSIYFPYSENFPNFRFSDTALPHSKLASLMAPTLVYTDRDADVVPGRKPIYCSTSVSKLCYYDVMVSDDFADANPTHIVTIGAVRAATPPSAPLKTELVTRTYNGHSRLTRQMDKLVSFSGNGGGSEVKVCRVNAYLQRSDEQVTDFAGDVTTVQFTRADIRKKRWKRIYSIWDPNWNYQDIEQIYAVYEDDTQGKKTLSGSLTTTVNLPGKIGKVEGEVGFKIEVLTQDEIITQKRVDRKSFLRDGMNNQGWGFIIDDSDFLAIGRDWPVVDGGAIWSYTFPYRIY
ncbi:MAG: hypothetical protein EOO01_12120 [Chitinophagaceae bacterium]|nr:MAG: hypothetical protein EOO01_12120 [Chitinophagaceae bacterium]